jgi:plasmid stabilization system protein ParE
MATLHYSQDFQIDLQRLLDFFLTGHTEDADGLVELILDGLETLQQHPSVGRIFNNGLRELVISRGKSGYLALYEYNPILDRVDILRIRHQRESGYRMIE